MCVSTLCLGIWIDESTDNSEKYNLALNVPLGIVIPLSRAIQMFFEFHDAEHAYSLQGNATL